MTSRLNCNMLSHTAIPISIWAPLFKEKVHNTIKWGHLCEYTASGTIYWRSACAILTSRRLVFSAYTSGTRCAFHVRYSKHRHNPRKRNVCQVSWYTHHLNSTQLNSRRTSIASNFLYWLWDFSTTFRRRRNLFSIPTSNFSTRRRNFKSLIWMVFYFLFKVHVNFSSISFL